MLHEITAQHHTLKNSLNGVSLCACGLGTESHICSSRNNGQKKTLLKLMSKARKHRHHISVPSEYLLSEQVLNFPVGSVNKEYLSNHKLN